MYRINDKSAAIRNIQKFLARISSDRAVVPNGVYDENTRLAIVDFQSRMGIAPSGTVDRRTLDMIYSEYISKINNDTLAKGVGSFISFPLREGEMNEAVIHLNKTLSDLLDHYGITHRLRSSSFYSTETAEAVKIMRKIYLLPEDTLVDEELYIRMIADHSSLGE